MTLLIILLILFYSWLVHVTPRVAFPECSLLNITRLNQTSCLDIKAFKIFLLTVC